MHSKRRTIEYTFQSQALDPISLRRQLELPNQVLSHSKATFAHKTEARFFEQKEIDRVVYSLLRIKDRFIARELYLRIASQEANFADLPGVIARDLRSNQRYYWSGSTGSSSSNII